ncbi:MAG: PTS sugar transporter subunit IIB [Defluviitaleaceae bacterium]|nr:PTS sugar transporter subunit IIB [Defluviitaleaceae bacterium]
MKIKNIRVDERLIHGQVASVWTNYLGCTRIIVANDLVIKNEMEISLLKMACPAGVKLSLLSVSKAVANINEGKYESDNVFLIFRNVSDARRAIDEGLAADVVNLGNVSHKPGGEKIKNTVSLQPLEIEDIKAMIEKGVKVTARMIPNHSEDDVAAYLK